MDEDTSPRSGCLGRYEGEPGGSGRWRAAVGQSGLGTSWLAGADLVEMIQKCDCPTSRSSTAGQFGLLDGAYSWCEGGFSFSAHRLSSPGAEQQNSSFVGSHCSCPGSSTAASEFRVQVMIIQKQSQALRWNLRKSRRNHIDDSKRYGI